MRLIAVAFLGMGLASAAWGGECAIGNDAPPVSVGTIDLEFPEHTGQPDQIYPISPWIEADFHDALSACDTSRPSSAQVVPTVNPGHFRGTYTEGGRNYFVFGSPLYLPPGVGIVFEYTHINSSDFIPIDFQKEMRLAILDPSPASLSFKARARLVVFGKFEPGIYPVSFGLLRYREFEPGGKGYTSANFRLSGMLKFVSKTCVLTSDAAPTIDLDPVKLGDFGGVGSHAGGARFDLSLRCDSNIRVHATITDASQPANRSTTLSLAPDSSAVGVGYQILRNDTVPVAFGPDDASTGAENQFHIADVPAGGGMVELPLKVRYIQTEPAITPGAVNAVATITFSYQ